MKNRQRQTLVADRNAILFALLLAIGILPQLCAAQAKSELASRSAPTSKKDEGYGYEFEDDPLNAGGFGPNDATFRVRPKAARTTLIRPRTSFVPEMLKSVENLLVAPNGLADLNQSASLTPDAIGVSDPPAAATQSLTDREGFLESETFIYIDHNGDGRFPYSLDATAFDPGDPDVYLWNITGLDWYKDNEDSVILTGEFLSNLPTLPQFLSIKLPVSQFRDAFMTDTYTPTENLLSSDSQLASSDFVPRLISPDVDRLPFTLTLDYGANGGVSVWEANGVLWPVTVPEPSTFGLFGLLGPAVLARTIRQRRARNRRLLLAHSYSAPADLASVGAND